MSTATATTAPTPATAFAEDKAGLRRYAHAGIPMVLTVDLHDSSIHLHTEPTGPTAEPGYGRVAVRRTGEWLEITLRSPALEATPITVGPIAAGSFFAPDL